MICCFFYLVCMNVMNKLLLNTLRDSTTKPDLIFIITDQERATQNFPDNWERENLKTLTFLKDNGFSFERAFCNTCMCSPSRSTLLTGTYPAQHQVTQTLTTGGNLSDAEQTLNPQTPNIARLLEPLGYDCQYRGKWHVSKGNNVGDPYGDVTAEDIALFGFKGWVGPDAGEDAKPENFGGGYANHDQMYIRQALEYLKEVKIRRSKGDHQPYCLVLSLVNPHDVLGYPNSVQYGYLPPQYTQRGIELPSTVNENLIENKKPLAQFQTNIAADGLLGVLKNDDMKLDYINFYGYLLRQIDAQIGTVIDELYRPYDGKQLLAHNALVIRTADHGEMGLSHGGMRQKAFVAYEEALRVPLVISNPILFGTDNNKSTYELATLIDVIPTMCDLLGITPPSDCRGTSLLPIMEEGKSVQEEILFTYDDTKSGSSTLPSSVKTCNRIRTIRTKDWKFSYYFDALGAYEAQYELYDLVNDPTEYTNLAYDPKYFNIRTQLTVKLKQLEREKLLVNDNTFSSMTWVDTNPVYQDYAYNKLSTIGDKSLNTY